MPTSEEIDKLVRKKVPPYFKPIEKMAPPSGFLTSGSHANVNVVNKRENCTTSG